MATPWGARIGIGGRSGLGGTAPHNQVAARAANRVDEMAMVAGMQHAVPRRYGVRELFFWSVSLLAMDGTAPPLKDDLSARIPTVQRDV